jgi:hypothetical protein
LLLRSQIRVFFHNFSGSCQHSESYPIYPSIIPIPTEKYNISADLFPPSSVSCGFPFPPLLHRNPRRHQNGQSRGQFLVTCARFFTNSQRSLWFRSIRLSPTQRTYRQGTLFTAVAAAAAPESPKFASCWLGFTHSRHFNCFNTRSAASSKSMKSFCAQR